MNTKDMIKKLERAQDALWAVISDLKDADAGDIPLLEVNDAYLREAISLTTSVNDALHAPAEGA